MNITKKQFDVFKYLERHYASDLGESAKVVRRITDGTRPTKPIMHASSEELNSLSRAVLAISQNSLKDLDDPLAFVPTQQDLIVLASKLQDANHLWE